MYVQKVIGYKFWNFQGNALLGSWEIQIWMNPIFRFFSNFLRKVKFLNLCKIVSV